MEYNTVIQSLRQINEKSKKQGSIIKYYHLYFKKSSYILLLYV